MQLLAASGQAESGFLGLLLAPYRRFLVFSQPGQPAVRLNAEVVAEEGLVEGVVRREEALAVSPP